MAEAMHNLGLVKEDLNTQKTKTDFPSENLQITELHFRYYRKKLLETINTLIMERRRLRAKYANLAQDGSDEVHLSRLSDRGSQ